MTACNQGTKTPMHNGDRLALKTEVKGVNTVKSASIKPKVLTKNKPHKNDLLFKHQCATSSILPTQATPVQNKHSPIHTSAIL